MKILYSCLSKSWGGMEMYTLTVIRKVLERNHQVELLCVAESRLHIEANNLGIIIHPIKTSGYFHPFIVFKIALLFKRNRYDIIHTQASKDLWIVVPALKIFSLKTQLFFTKQVGSFVGKKDILHRFLYGRVDKAFAISTVIKNNLLETTPLKDEKIKLIFNGVDVSKFDPAKSEREKIRREFNFEDQDIVIGMIARFSPGKGHEEFLKAAKQLSDKFNNLKFIVVGEASLGEDDYASSIKNMAVQLELKNILFAGFRSDTADILSAMDIFVFPSHAEAFGIALIEAMAMEKATVCSNSDGVLDIAVDNETGLMFKVKDADDLAKKLEILILNPAKCKIMGVNARKRVVDNFEIEKITKQTINEYLKLIDEKR